MSEKSEIELSATYYWDHFSYILRYIDRHYLPLLQESEIVFLQDFSDLSFAAQCLFLRLASRRSPYFRIEKLAYPEIGDIARPLQVLRSAGFLMDISQSRNVFLWLKNKASKFLAPLLKTK